MSRDIYRAIRFAVPFLLLAAILRPLFVSDPMTAGEVIGYIGLGIMLGAMAHLVITWRNRK